MSTPVLILLTIFLQSFLVRASEKEGVFDKIKSGLQYATDYLKTAKEIADLVSRSLGHRNNDRNHSKGEEEANRNRKNDEKRGDDSGRDDGRSKNSKTPNLLSGFFRLLGLDSPRIAAIAVNSVIFLAQMISSLFEVKPKLVEESRARSDESLFDPLDFIVENKNEKVQSLVEQAKDPRLPIHLIEKLDGPNSACVRLFICKSSPIILAAQNSLKNRTVERRFDITSWLPRMEDFEDNADRCDEKHDDCALFPE
ncbi:uncharacterized protein [Venturia canescens]|uniref:uncharacterized protein n=1 Tax=Venturia canescens TaxID=32260 RepID=UPI001C9D5DBA|nr:uncharacterized protein LOC122418105 [Venturia canescens]